MNALSRLTRTCSRSAFHFSPVPNWVVKRGPNRPWLRHFHGRCECPAHLRCYSATYLGRCITLRQNRIRMLNPSRRWKLKATFIALSLVALASGCSTMTPARYAMSVDNHQALKKLDGAKVRLVALTSVAPFDANCRLMGPIQAADGMTIPEFVKKAFNDELKFAGIYSDSGVTLSGQFTKIEFSSTAGLTNGWWLLGVKLQSSNGTSLSAENRYEFKSGFDAITACNQTAQALGPAVQDLIKSAVTDPMFANLVR